MTAYPIDAPSSEAAEAQPDEFRFRFHGSGSSFFLIFLKHVFLTLVTFGIYLAWAKTERRAYIWKSLEFHGQTLRYTGTAIELLKGYAIVAAGYVVFIGLPVLVSGISPELGAAIEVAMIIGIILVAPVVIYKSRAFLYSRTTWRGIRFGLVPGAGPYAKQFFAGMFLTPLTLGLYLPVNTNRLHRIVTDNTRFGGLAFRYTGVDREVWMLALKGFIFSILTLGIYYPWYRAGLERYRASHTHVGSGAVLRSTVTGGQLFGLFVLNVVGLTLTLGLAFPWITMYSIRILADRYTICGVIDFDAIEQIAEVEGAIADGFADALDLGLGL